jgi:hypothetical protein
MTSDAELKAVKFLLNIDWPEGTSDTTVATAVIKALDGVRSTTWRPIGPPPKVGDTFKSIITSKTHYVMWIGKESPQGPELAWIVTADSDYGWLSRSDSPLWKWTVAARVQEKTREKAITNEIGMVAGDKITLRQDGQYEILASFCRGVLMRSHQTGQIWPETNANIRKYYRDGWK